MLKATYFHRIILFQCHCAKDSQIVRIRQIYVFDCRTFKYKNVYICISERP